MLRTLFLFTMILTLTACGVKNLKVDHLDFKGSWLLKSVQYISDEKTITIDPAQPGIFIFEKEAYSIQWAPVREPRTAFKVLSKPTDEEAIQGFKTVVFNAGTYQHTERRITTKALIAKVPGFEGGQIFYKYHFENNRLILTMIDEIYPDGTKPSWSGVYQTRFELERLN